MLKSVELSTQLEDKPWLTNSTAEFVEDNNWYFIKYKNYLNKKVNEKVSEDEYKNNIRYLKVKLMKNMTPKKHNDFLEKEHKTVRMSLCKLVENVDLIDLDLLDLDLEDVEVDILFIMLYL